MAISKKAWIVIGVVAVFAAAGRNNQSTNVSTPSSTTGASTTQLASTPTTSTPSYEPEYKPTPKPKDECINVSAKKLGADFHSNEARANKKYKNACMNISGTVDRVTEGVFGGQTVYLKSDNMFLDVHADMKGDASQYDKGDRVKLTCHGSNMVIGSVMVDDCE